MATAASTTGEMLKTIVTVVGLAGGTIALVEKVWRGGVWLVRDRRDRAWAKAVLQYLAAPQDEAPAVQRPERAEFIYTGGRDDAERRCIVHAKRERAALWGVKEGFFLSERDKEGRLVLRVRVDGRPAGESLRNTIRRVYDDLAEKERRK